MTVSGVRSSCEALATKRRWLAKAPDSRSSIASKVSASSLSSSRGPSSAMRSSSVSCETQPRRRGDPLQRAQRAPGDQPPQQHRERGHRGQRERVLHAQARERVVGHLVLDGAAQLVGLTVADRDVVGGEVVAHEDVADGQQRRAGEQEDARVEQGQAQADRRAWHQTR